MVGPSPHASRRRSSRGSSASMTRASGCAWHRRDATHWSRFSTPSPQRRSQPTTPWDGCTSSGRRTRTRMRLTHPNGRSEVRIWGQCDTIVSPRTTWSGSCSRTPSARGGPPDILTARLSRTSEYLRFNDEIRPAIGSFEGWPDHVSEVTVMDPCCGSGHFLVEAFSMLWKMRAAVSEGLEPIGRARCCTTRQSLRP